jgi:hypothetical protein
MELDTLEGQYNRREDRFRFDKNINISAVVGAIILLGTMISYGNSIIREQRETGQKVNIMWQWFVSDKPDLQKLFDR